MGEPPVLPTPKSALAKSNRGPGVPKAAEARAPKRWRPRCSQLGGGPCPKLAGASVLYKAIEAPAPSRGSPRVPKAA